MADHVARRRVPRREFIRQVGVLLLGKYFISHALELGEGGILLEMAETLEVGQKLVITFALPGSRPAVVRGTIRYGLPGSSPKLKRYGIEFANLDFQAKRDIRNYVASKSEEEYKKTASQ
jgi:hypothetical protein